MAISRWIRTVACCARSTLCVWLIAMAGGSRAVSAAAPPNIVYILCDDLGYGDVRCINPDGKIPTPQMDRLAAGGMVFTDAHSGSAVCTPTRYGILTGRYCWRSSLKQGVLGGVSPPLIEPGRPTVASFLKEAGYATACIGKWHLGMNWPRTGGDKGKDVIDYSRPIQGGPTAVGFDTYFGISASLDMPPFVYIENDRVTALPTVEKKWVRKGPASPDFEAMDVLSDLTGRAVGYINRQAASAKEGRPFFLYLPFASPHTPILPTKEWQGKSGLNAYADFVMQTDAAVGAVLDALERNGLAAGTLVILTSDNGCSPEAKIPQLRNRDHDPSAGFRGTKADIFEGGHRIPFIARWPGRVKPGTRSDRTVCLTDLFATCAAILGRKLPDHAAVDSVSLLPVLLGEAAAPQREPVVHHSINGSFAIRQGKWKLCLCANSGGWSAPKPGGPSSEKLPPVQLYDLADDPAESRNVHAEHPEVVARLAALLEKFAAEGRSTPGPPQSNTGEVRIRSAPNAR